MINYVQMYNDLINRSCFLTNSQSKTFAFILACILGLSIPTIIFFAYEKEIKRQKPLYRKISYGITVFMTFMVLIAEIAFFSNSQKEIRKYKTDYNISVLKLMKNVEFLKSEISYLTIKDKDLYMNKLLNKFYGNDEKNLNAEEKELIGKLVK